MCFACTEYIKNRLTTIELKAALREVGVKDPTHQKQVEDLMKKHGDDTDELKRLMKPIEKEFKDY
ncbi:MAG: hypothetical protein HYR96_11430 [Deltaproteobacteria bacterium]|nr:hypothetical protein [Deltaproteobacteria bacterium]MBI3293259.1 hypothetical protein [Deltaproteobacteria bacterium]